MSGSVQVGASPYMHSSPEVPWHSTLGHTSHIILDTRNCQWEPYSTLVKKSARFFLVRILTTRPHPWQQPHALHGNKSLLISFWELTQADSHWWQSTCCPHTHTRVLSLGHSSYRAYSECNTASQCHASDLSHLEVKKMKYVNLVVQIHKMEL